jgi:hypothetical protein
MALVTLVVSFLSVSRLVQARAVVPDHRAIVHRQESSDDPVIVLPIQRLEGSVGANLSNYIVNSMFNLCLLDTNDNMCQSQ